MAWTARIARFIKSLDPNHLVLDGTYGVNTDALTIDEVDLYSDHFYPMNVDRLKSDVALTTAANKPFIVGEYGWTQGDLPTFLSTIRTLSQSGSLVGDTYWSFFPHADSFGYVQHGDGFTVHYPGDTAAMRTAVQALRGHAYAMQGVAVPPPFDVQSPPGKVVFPNASSIAWRGTAGADKYSVALGLTQNGPWTTVCEQCVTDNDLPMTIPGRGVGLDFDMGMGVTRHGHVRGSDASNHGNVGSWAKVTPFSVGGKAGPSCIVAPEP